MAKGYGRASYPPPSRLEKGTPRCEKCAHFLILPPNWDVACAREHPMQPFQCPSYRDISQPMEVIDLNYDGRMRR